jgi:hypothetical protein
LRFIWIRQGCRIFCKNEKFPPTQKNRTKISPALSKQKKCFAFKYFLKEMKGEKRLLYA